MRSLRSTFTALAVAVTLLGCGSSSTTNTTSPGTTAPGTTSPVTTTPATEVSGNLTVGAATSLTKVFTALVADFEQRHPKAKITLSFASSKDVRVNINNGAPIDVFASSDWTNMKAVTVGFVHEPVEFATNSLAIAVAPGNPKGIATLADLAKAGVTVATGSDGVPIRTYTDQMLTKNNLLAGVSANYNNFAANVAGVVTCVANGGSDAGVVYRTDVTTAGSSILGVAIPADQNVVAHFPIAELSGSTNHALAQAFIDYVHSADGQNILTTFGFGAG